MSTSDNHHNTSLPQDELEQSGRHMTYAVFPSAERAVAAEAAVDEVIDSMELLTNEEDLTEDKVPLRLTMARLGAIFGAALAASAGVLALWLLVMSGLPGAPSLRHVYAPWSMLGAVAAVAALLGGLAGALSFSTRFQARIDRLRKVLHRGNAVLLVETEYEVDDALRRRGAVQVGSLD